MRARGFPRLYDDEADRLRALSFVALLLLLPSAARLWPAAPPPVPTVWCEGDCGPGTTMAALVRGQSLDLNQVDAATLEGLDGIGPSLAQAIVADRTARGPFRSVPDVERVKGIGPARRRALAPFLTVLPAP